MQETKKYHLIGYASGLAGANAHVGDGPLVVQKSPYLSSRANLNWVAMLKDHQTDSVENSVYDVCHQLALQTLKLTKSKHKFTVIGGDHSCAIGTWSGVHEAIHQQGDMGLIWIDAHMDSHTPETSDSGRIHGMPLAVLLGHGMSSLTTMMNPHPKIKPEHLCLIGVRSYEAGEAALLKKLNVHVYYMDEVKQRGFSTIFHEALKRVKQGTVGYGITVDIDSLDPLEAPGVDVPESDGIHVDELKKALTEIANDPLLIATELVEFDPVNDKDKKTEKIIADCIDILSRGKTE